MLVTHMCLHQNQMTRLFSFRSLSVVALLFGCFVSQSFAENSDHSEISPSIKLLLSKKTEAAYKSIVSNCSVLYANESELLKALFSENMIELITKLLYSSCNDDDEFFEKAVLFGANSPDHQVPLKFIYDEFVLKNNHVAQRSGFIVNQCATTKNYTCLGWFGESKLCRLTNSKGQSILHLAVSLEDDFLYEISARSCPLLMDYCDLDGLFPMEYVHSARFATLLNDLWLQESKSHLLSLKLATIRQLMCHKFDIDPGVTVSGSSESENNVKILSETLLSDFSDLEEYYCPYLKMKINFLDTMGVDHSGLILEWLSYLLIELFSPSNQYFKLNDTKKKYVITGMYDEDVYEKIGIIMAIANYFGLGHQYSYIGKDPSEGGKIAEKMQECYEAFIKGKDSAKFLRLEQHYSRQNKAYIYVLKGKEKQDNFIINFKTNLSPAPHSRSNKKKKASKSMNEQQVAILKAFEKFSQLNDQNKLNLIKSASKSASDPTVIDINVEDL